MNRQLQDPTGLRLSFLQLIKKYQLIEIPLIQRDYAQGRESARGVRDRFLKSLWDALQSGTPLSLDFVYGEVTDSEIRRYQPIDGQQRLTTLFLLHWFLSCAVGGDFNQAMKDKDGISRFQYAVRPSSHQFFLKLLDYFPDISKNTLVEDIKDQTWFRRGWLHDPTILGALTMLNEIQKLFSKESGIEGFYGKLKDASPITMDVLDLGSVGLSDGIYVKMNARGKELTGFEKFKAWLIERLNDIEFWTEDASKWTIQLDQNWLDLFWRFHHDRKNPSESVSKVYFRTFVALAVNFRASEDGRFEIEWLKADNDDQEKLWEDLFRPSCLKNVFESLQCLSDHAQNQECQIKLIRDLLKIKNVAPFNQEKLAEVFFDNDTVSTTGVTYPDRIWLHAIHLFLSKRMDDEAAIHWFRVIRNLLANTTIDNRNFSNAVMCLDELGAKVKASGSVLNVLANADISLIGFDKNQVNEEIRKAKFICCQSEWESEITVAESHPFFHGQIDLLLSDDMDLEKFKNRWTIFSKLFDTDGSRIGRDEYLLQRAILTQSEPIKLEGKQSIGFSEKNWPNLLKRNCERMEFRRGMQILIDELIGVKDLGEKLRGMLKFKQAIEAWMNDIILYGDVLFKNSNLKKIQNFWGNGVFLYYKNNSNDLDIFLGANAAFRNRLINYLLKQSELGWRIVPNGRVFLRDEIVFYKGRRIELIRKSENDEGVVFRFEYDKLVVWCKTATDPIVLDVLYPTNGDLDQFITSVELISDNSSNKRLIDFFQRAFIHN